MLKAKATCKWTDRSTTSFRWTRDELIPPPPLDQNKVSGRDRTTGLNGKVHTSPLFPLRTVEGVNAYVELYIKSFNSELEFFAAAVKSTAPIDWRNFEAAVWIQAANGVQLGEKMGAGGHKLEAHVVAKLLANGGFDITLQLLVAGAVEEQIWWKGRHWLENKFGKKCDMWQYALTFKKGRNLVIAKQSGPRMAFFDFSAGSDVFLCFHISRFEQQPAIVERQPEIVQQNGPDPVHSEDDEVTDELNIAYYLDPEMNDSGDQQELPADTTLAAP
ncbi:hypothetical protein M3Y99_01385800 [Aphelenchoides fujianensis]|nr:hypothetical protein M3Y99_01385800 [Aphelenchoides fujianensis]